MVFDLLWLNILLLPALSFAPFPTGMIGDYTLNAVGLALFTAVFLLASVTLTLMWYYAYCMMKRQQLEQSLRKEM